MEQLGRGSLSGGVVATLLKDTRSVAADTPGEGKVKRRRLGTTDLEVSEVGFGGHSWSYKRTPDGSGGYREVTANEALEMISAGLDMGVNFFDSCTPVRECTLPGEALKKLKRRDEAIICVRPSHKMKGVENDKQEVYKWTEERLKAWQIDHIDLLLLSNTEGVTPQSGYWDMSYSIEALDKLKGEGRENDWSKALAFDALFLAMKEDRLVFRKFMSIPRPEMETLSKQLEETVRRGSI